MTGMDNKLRQGSRGFEEGNEGFFRKIHEGKVSAPKGWILLDRFNKQSILSRRGSQIID